MYKVTVNGVNSNFINRCSKSYLLWIGVYRVETASWLCGKTDQQSRKNVENFLKKNMEVLIVNLSKELDFEDFYEEFVDKNELESKEEYGYFITTFNFDVDDFLKNHQEFLQKEYENLKHLIEKRK